MEPLRENAIHHERTVKIICVGAGASGLCLAYKLKRHFKNYTLDVYEKNAGIGGTWFENRYPGCACDVPAHNYAFSFEPKSDFPSVYASSQEIRKYFEDFATKYDLNGAIHKSHLVTTAEWSESKGEWYVEVKNLASNTTFSDRCHILVHATGYLNNPAWPQVPGLDEYKGIKLHSANYDPQLSINNKNVILIGGGSSAIQILPAIQPLVKQVVIVIRTPSWLLPDISTESREYTAQEIATFGRDPGVVLKLRQENERTMNSIFTVYLKGSVLQQQSRSLLESSTKKLLNHDALAHSLIPNYAVGCKRVIPSSAAFLRALKRDNVRVSTHGVTAFNGTGCITSDGVQHNADVIICATGFDTSYIPRYPIIAHGRDLQDEWATSIKGYMGVGIPSFPNTFTLLGPYTPVSNGPTLIAIEAQADYVCSFIDRYQTEPIHSFSPKPAATEDFIEHVASTMQNLVWTDDCPNSHNNHSIGSRVPTTWPGSTLHYLEAIREPRADDWDFVYRGNRFSWLGDGISQAEWEPTADLAYYIRQRDDGDALSRRGRNLVIAKTGSQPQRLLHRQAKLEQASAASVTDKEEPKIR